MILQVLLLLLLFFTVLMERNHRAEELLIDLRAKYSQAVMGKQGKIPKMPDTMIIVNERKDYRIVDT